MAPRRPAARAFFGDPVGFAESHPARLVELSAPVGNAALVQDPAEAWRILVTDAAQFRQGKWKRRARRFLGPTLNTLDGPEHRERRLLLQPALDRRLVAEARPRLVARALRAQASWQPGDRVKVRELLDPLSLAMAGDVLFGTDLEPQAIELAQSLATVMARLPRLTPALPGTAQARALRRVHETARALLSTPVEGDPPNLLTILQQSGLPEETCVGEITAFLLAAVDEPPSGLSAAFYYLALNRAAEQRLGSELAAAFPSGGPSDDTAELPYLEAVIDEALRLLPPARHIDRCPAAAAVVCGTEVRAGTNLLLSPLVLQRSRAVFAAPDSFRPERWLDGAREGIPRGAYVPFGAGAHTCIGEPLARLIMTVTLASVCRQWRLRLDADPGPPVPGQPELEFTIERG